LKSKHTKARSVVAWIFGIYATIVVLCNLPFMQRAFASWTANALENQLGTKVEIRSINVGFLNNIIINDLYVEDKEHKEMLKVARVSASINLFKLIANGQIYISTAQLFGTKANLYKKTPKDDYNFQFVIDAFKSDDKESKPINLQINSLIVRKANIKYNILSEEAKTTFDPNHLNIQNAGFNLSLKNFTSDSINVSLKRFAAKETNSGLDIKEFAIVLEGNAEKARCSKLCLRLPYSKIEVDSINVSYPNFSKDKSFEFGETSINASLIPADFKFITKDVTDFGDRLDLTTTLSGSDKELDIKRLLLSSANNTISTDAVANIKDYTTSNPTFRANINNLSIANGETENLISHFIDDVSNLKPLFNLGAINFVGNIYKDDIALTSEGKITTDAGGLTYSATLSKDKLLDANFETTDIDVKQILEDEKFGILNMNANAIVDLATKNKIPVGNIKSTISNFVYNGYNYSNINLDAINNATDIILKASSEDENINFTLDGKVSNFEQGTKNIVASLDMKSINPHAIHLANEMVGETYSFSLNTHGNFADIDNLEGNATIHDIAIHTADSKKTLDNIIIDANLNGSNNQKISVTSDILDANITGRFKVEELINNFQNIVSHHLPLVVEQKPSTSNADIQYNITFYDAPILHHFINENYTVDKPVNINGSLNSIGNILNLTCYAPKVSFNDNVFEDIHINCSSSNANMSVQLEAKNNADKSNTIGKIFATARNNKIESDIQLNNQSKDKFDLDLISTTTFANNNGHLMTSLDILKSKLAINNDDWSISPAKISYCNKQVECRNFKISKGQQYLEVNGIASPNPNDSIIAKLNDVEVAYILDLVNFHSVDFGGKASGKAVVNNIFGKPDAYANLYVHDFSLAGGVMGDANILAHWDKEKDGIAVNAHIVEDYVSQVGLTGTKVNVNGVTDVNGYILPTKNELELHVLANKTPAHFLSGFIGSIFKDIDGHLTGEVNVVGPFSDINLIGYATADMSLKLAATKVPYCISNETIHLNYREFNFEDIKIHDKQNNVGVVNGKMTHINLANFHYDFTADITNLCAYNETEFNADKYMAQVWANGNIHVYGADGHPITIDANVSPCKGSVFAYDSATPDALISNSFIDFRDITDGQPESSNTSFITIGKDTEHTDSLVFNKDDYQYLGDLYMNVNIDLNPNCEIKLRMDNTKDGYISTFGNGTFQAKYYNKGSFQLFGNYNITSGKYRLYLQDLVYRNLDIQDGSKVEFNGNPFDANIHLICKHEINSVPLSDLTTTKAFTSNNKVKVDCYLDITGHLDNMDLSFKFELPNVSEETRQLVRSMINSDEEMNKQMIYLLGFQRFYPNELAQSNIEEYGTQAVNSLLSSTISGQINQLLSNMIGSRSKWNFGTGITTGENGWQDLDVEGMLSGRLFNDRLLINGAFGYRDNSLTNQANFIGDFEVKYRIWENGDFYAKAYNQTNDRYFTKATLNTQGIGVSFQHDFEKYTLFNMFRRKAVQTNDSTNQK